MSEHEKLPIPDKNPFPDLFPDQYLLFKNTRLQLKRVLKLSDSTFLMITYAIISFVSVSSIILNSVFYFHYDQQLPKNILAIKVSFLLFFISTLIVLTYYLVNKRRQKNNIETISNFRNKLSEENIQQIIICLRDITKTYSIEPLHAPNSYELALTWLATSDSIILYRSFEYLFSADEDCLQVSMQDDEYISNHYSTTTFTGILIEHRDDEIRKREDQKKKIMREELEHQLVKLGNNSRSI